MPMQTHVNLSSFHHQLRNLNSICKHIDITEYKNIVYALVTSRLDYADVYGFPPKTNSVLQRVQNSVAWLIMRSGRRT